MRLGHRRTRRILPARLSPPRMRGHRPEAKHPTRIAGQPVDSDVGWGKLIIAVLSSRNRLGKLTHTTRTLGANDSARAQTLGADVGVNRITSEEVGGKNLPPPAPSTSQGMRRSLSPGRAVRVERRPGQLDGERRGEGEDERLPPLRGVRGCGFDLNARPAATHLYGCRVARPSLLGPSVRVASG